MRDYKNQTSRPRAPEARPPITARRPLEPEDDSEETPPRPARSWPWVLLLLLVIMLSAGVWWWIAQLPISTGKLGLISSGAGLSAAMTASNSAPASTQQQPVSPAATHPSASTPAPLTSMQKTPVRRALAVATASSAAVASTHSGVDFSFYHILPNMHVDIPADILGNSPGIPSAASTSSTSAVHQPVTIQVGAFTNRAAAVVLRDRLALLGVSIQMEKVEASNNNTLYRLRTGTFDSLAAAQPTLAKIRGMGITPLLLGSGIIGSGAINGPLSQSPTP
jgi:hypothetical protein